MHGNAITCTYTAYLPTYVLCITVPLNYNFIYTHVDMHGNKRYFMCKMPKFVVEIISMR